MSFNDVPYVNSNELTNCSISQALITEQVSPKHGSYVATDYLLVASSRFPFWACDLETFFTRPISIITSR